MDAKFIRPIPKYILTRIEKQDKIECPAQVGIRFYSYFAKLQKELVKITVAVKDHKRKRYIKQVAVHGVKSEHCMIRDLEYNYIGMGFRVGWYAEGITRYQKWFESGNWCHAKVKYYNVWSTAVNFELIAKFSEYRYSACQYFRGRCLIQYLRLYERFPQVEYLLKLGLEKIHDSVMILRRIKKDKKFCKWLIQNRDEIASKYHYATTILQAYKSGNSLAQIQVLNEFKKKLACDADLKPIREMVRGKEAERFFSYLEAQSAAPRDYRDYLNACNYLGLDMALPKNRYPHDFKRWHDIRIDEYHTAKALADEKERAELYAQFAAVAEKYMALQKLKGGYAVIIATSPADLMREGELLGHCVGKMNYGQRMAREETLIFFVRNAVSPDVPFVTVEYSLKSRKVLQCYGQGNLRPDESVINYVHKVWQPHANKEIKKLQAA
ncbi:MAG: PcfJ domain-containing protein [Firmicutes bacterium]|nr:PcfJ domain-containing protein [Bacillota bacterium]